MRVVLGLLVLVVLCTPAKSEGKTSLALFSLTPASIDAIGLDGDLLFSMRKELERSQTYQLISRRQMEEGLYRLGGAQVSETDKVIEYGNGLGVNFILTGSIDIRRATIIVDFKLIDVSHSLEAAIWQERFQTQGELVTRAPEIVASLERRIRRAESIKPKVDSKATALSSFSVVAKGEQAVLNWEVGDIGAVFYYNLYRGQSLNGPFEFVESTTEAHYVDTRIPASGSYFYRLDIILETGEELDGGRIANTSIAKSVISADIAAPAILQHTALLNGVQLAFVPSIGNNVQAAGYQTYVREVNGSWEPAIKVAASGEINYTVTAVNLLGAGKTYEFAITTITASGKESAKSTPVRVTTPDSMVLQVDPVVATRQIKLSWAPSLSEHGVKIDRRVVGSEEWTTVDTLAVGHNGSYTDNKGLDDGVEYQYRVSAFDALSTSAFSNLIAHATKKLPAPTQFEVSGGVKSVRLNWQPVDDPDVVGYRIYRSSGTLTQDTLLDDLATVKGRESNSFIDGVDNQQALLDGADYHYVVVALNAFDGVGEVTLTKSAKTKPRPAQANSPKATIEQGFIRLHWPASTELDIKQYRLYRSWNQGTWQQVAIIAAPDCEYLDKDIKPYASTAYYVVAEDSDGLLSDQSAQIAIQSPDEILVKVTAEGLLRKVQLAWSAHNNIDGYKVYRRQQGNSRWTLITTIKSANTTQYTDNDTKNLIDGMTYEYAVAAIDGDAETVKSQPVSAKTKPIPAPPSQFNAQSGGVKQVTLSWTPIDDPDVRGYKIYRAQGEAFELLETLNQRNSNTFTDTGSFFSKLKDGQRYRYKITAHNLFNADGFESPVVEAVTKPLPQRVQGVTVVESAANVVLDWSASPETDVVSYQVYRGSSCSNTRKVATVATPKYVDSDVSGGRSYCYQVSAIDSDDLEGARSNGREITTAERSEGGE